jgi:hypothetical protein
MAAAPLLRHVVTQKSFRLESWLGTPLHSIRWRDHRFQREAQRDSFSLFITYCSSCIVLAATNMTLVQANRR